MDQGVLASQLHPWDKQPVTAGAGSGYLEASLYLLCCVFWLGFTAEHSAVAQASASLSLEILHAALSSISV